MLSWLFSAPQLGGGLHHQQVAMGQLQVEGLAGGAGEGALERTLAGLGLGRRPTSPLIRCQTLDWQRAPGKSAMNDILFVVEEAKDGSFRANAVGSSIHTEAEDLEQLHQEIRDAVPCHLEEGDAPPLIRLHHVRQELLAL
jgi:hypothetical protein